MKIAYGLIILLLLAAIGHGGYLLYQQRSMLETRHRLAAQIDEDWQAGFDISAMRGAEAFLATRPRNPSVDLDRTVLALYGSSLFRWIRRNPDTPTKDVEAELERFTAAQKILETQAGAIR
ncbi:hypothetical protein [Mesorhizobium sp. B1-1-8]|uniref:hypothetical protein n=1 Tax=Mesorhizobium sp. B1-1-8 TaxID=2589976 RepID=UPI00112AEE2B|nr:hypothetical protein [Mesorhizobium sp. B1-1-8]UCI07355.1 hypothetical protein FJ974_26825 [Mesorhizobium sp. B1-1-8]